MNEVWAEGSESDLNSHVTVLSSKNLGDTAAQRPAGLFQLVQRHVANDKSGPLQCPEMDR